MATQNITIATTWTKVVDAAVDSFLLTFTDGLDIIEIASVTVDAAPVIMGHRLVTGQAITRDLIGAGHVYCKLVAPAHLDNITGILS